ncbi:MAG: pyridoxal-dependent decarboxylase [Acidimicrobiales bacterium]
MAAEMDESRQALRFAAERADAYLTELRGRRVFPSDNALAALTELEGPLPDAGHAAIETLELLDRVGSAATVASTGPRYFGFVTGGVLPPALGAAVLSSTWDQNAALAAMSPLAARLHGVTNRWTNELLNLGPDAKISFVTGATMANATALIAARDQVLRQVGWNVTADGLFGAPPIRVLVGEQAHSTVFKALGMIGLGRSRVERLEVDDQGAIRADALPDYDGTPTILCAQAGEVNTGAFDPFGALADWCSGNNAWLHIDGAFGLWVAASRKYAHLVNGVERADSWATDAHKWLNVTYDCGLAIVADAATLYNSMTANAAYLPTGAADPDAMMMSPQSSQRARSIEYWAALHSLGRTGLADLIERCCRHARRFADGLAKGGAQIANEVVLNQVLVRFGDSERTAAVIVKVQSDGRTWCGPTEWQGATAMRISTSSWATTDEDVETAIDAILEAHRSV